MDDQPNETCYEELNFNVFFRKAYLLCHGVVSKSVTVPQDAQYPS